MLCWKYSASHTYFLNEYWVIVPLVIITDYIVIRKIFAHREKVKQLDKQVHKIRLKSFSLILLYNDIVEP